MRAGQLRHRVQFNEKGTPTRDSLGVEDPDWAELATVWASIEPLRGREFLEGRQEANEVTHRIRIRYRADITPQLQAVWVDGSTTRTFDVVSVIEPETRRSELVCMASEIL